MPALDLGVEDPPQVRDLVCTNVSHRAGPLEAGHAHA